MVLKNAIQLYLSNTSEKVLQERLQDSPFVQLSKLLKILVYFGSILFMAVNIVIAFGYLFSNFENVGNNFY